MKLSEQAREYNAEFRPTARNNCTLSARPLATPLLDVYSYVVPLPFAPIYAYSASALASRRREIL